VGGRVAGDVVGFGCADFWEKVKAVRAACSHAWTTPPGSSRANRRAVTYEASQLADVLSQHLGVTTADLEVLN
jgi:hypothetical protein